MKLLTAQFVGYRLGERAVHEPLEIEVRCPQGWTTQQVWEGVREHYCILVTQKLEEEE